MRIVATAIVALFVLPMTASAQGASASSATAVAKNYLKANARKYGLDRQDSLVSAGPTRSLSGLKVVRLEQLRDGVPVIAGELVVTTDGASRVLSVGGETSDADFGATEPALTAKAATARAIASIAKHAKTGSAGLFSGGAELRFFDPELLGSEAVAVADKGLVWVVKVRSLIDDSIARDVMVDARSGAIGLQLAVKRDALDRRICDANSTSAHSPCDTPVRTEGQAATGITEVDNAYEYSGDYHSFLSSHFGRDSIDNAGMPLIATVRYCEYVDDCPYANAYWFEGQVTLGEGYAEDDVIGHEFSHGLTETLFKPLYWFQTGAIDESYADVFGELMDQTNGSANDTIPNRWLIGEDVSGGTIRNMANPTQFGDPDSTFSPLYYGIYEGDDPAYQDYGGVHGNSGVPNRAAVLLTDGGTLNARNVAAIGADKTLRLWYATALSKLSPGSDFADLAAGLKATCTELAGANVDGFTAANCASVGQAIAATGLELDPPVASAPEAPMCTTGAVTGIVAGDDAETPGGLMQLGPGTSWYASNTRVHAGDVGFARDNEAFETDDSLTSSPVVLPANAMLRFDHLYNFESDGVDNYDGGVVEYSVGGGAWQDVGGLPMINGYSGPITGDTGNVLGNRAGFVTSSNGFRSTRVDFSALAGRSIRIRFRYGSDSSVTWEHGWAVDDIKFYTCPPPPPPAPPHVATPVAPPAKQAIKRLKAKVTKRNVKLTFSVANASKGARVQCKLDRGRWKICRSPKKYRWLKPGRHKVKVRVISSAGTTTATKSFKIRK